MSVFFLRNYLYVEIFQNFIVFLSSNCVTVIEKELIYEIILLLLFIMQACVHSKRFIAEIKILTIHPDVQSYFHYESSGLDVISKNLYICGYLLPRIEPYKRGAYKIRIILPGEFPFKPPILELLTQIYHPAINNDSPIPKFCNQCFGIVWTLNTRISEWLEQYINVIERPDIRHRMYCTGNKEAEELYHQNRLEYEQNALTVVQNCSHPRPHRSVVSLKFATKQIICKQLSFQSTKINQLPLCSTLKRYLD